MLKVNCKTEATILLQKLVPFQGHLKKRKKEDIDALINSLEHDGMMMPFAVWHHEDKESVPPVWHEDIILLPDIIFDITQNLVM